jgi:outer membrane immunogenic protein
MKMALLVTAAASAIVASGAAFAADLGVPMKAPPPPPPVFSWTGCYIGTNSGLGAQTDFEGGVVGGQVGCDLQWAGNWVVGVQGLWDWSDMSGTSIDQFNAPWAMQDRVQWFASATARLGWAASTWAPNNLLLYAKGGAAWVHHQLDIENSGTFIGNPSYTQLGWTVGGGLEWAFIPNVSVFIETDYYQFGNKTSSLLPVAGFDNPPFTFTTKSQFETITIGLNWRWGGWAGPVAPVVGRY